MTVQRSNIPSNGASASSAGSSSENSHPNGGGPSGRLRRSGAAASNVGGNNNPNNNNAFNPRLILAQIISLQAFLYAWLGFVFQIHHLIYATSISIDRIFTARYLDVWSAEGWTDNAAVLSSMMFGAFLLALIVEKSKKCLDFSVTVLAIHAMACTLYDGFPSTWDWWIIHVLGTIIMIVMGEYLCSKRELSEIPLLVL